MRALLIAVPLFFISLFVLFIYHAFVGEVRDEKRFPYVTLSALTFVLLIGAILLI